MNRVIKKLLILLLALLMGASILLSLLIFGIDQILHSRRFFSHRLNEIASVLEGEEVTEDLVDGMVDLLSRELGASMPWEVRNMVDRAAVESFTGPWLVGTAADIVSSLQAVLKGDKKQIHFSLSLMDFKNNLAVLLYRTGRFKEAEIQMGLREIPNSVSLEEIIPREKLELVERRIRAYPLYALGLMYGIPLVFMGLLASLMTSLKKGAVILGVPFVISSLMARGIIFSLPRKGLGLLYSLLGRRELVAFEVPLKAALLEYGRFMSPAVNMALIGGILLIGGGWVLGEAMDSGRFGPLLTKKEKGI